MPAQTSGARPRRSKRFTPVLWLCPILLAASAAWLGQGERARGDHLSNAEVVREALKAATTAHILDERETIHNADRTRASNTVEPLRGPAVGQLARALRVSEGEVKHRYWDQRYVCSFQRGEAEVAMAMLSRDRQGRDWMYFQAGKQEHYFQMEQGALAEVGRLFKSARAKRLGTR